MKAVPQVNTERVNVYIDGPNLLGAVSEIRKGRIWLDPYTLAVRLLRRPAQQLGTIYYVETPYRGNLHNPAVFRRQQRFFGKIYKHITAGAVVHLQGVYRIDEVRVPARLVQALSGDIRCAVEELIWHKPIEKGADVALAVQMVRDACLNQYDHALLVAADQDYAPAVGCVREDLKKQVSICYVQNSYRTAMALRSRCGNPAFVQITRGMIDACELV